ncbi:hypothetical protein D9M69_614390 [compost metagenome]
MLRVKLGEQVIAEQLGMHSAHATFLEQVNPVAIPTQRMFTAIAEYRRCIHHDLAPGLQPLSIGNQLIQLVVKRSIKIDLLQQFLQKRARLLHIFPSTTA